MFKAKNLKKPKTFISCADLIRKLSIRLLCIAIFYIISIGCTAPLPTRNDGGEASPLPPNTNIEPTKGTSEIQSSPTSNSQESNQPIESSSSNASTPISAQLILSKAPALHEPVNLSFHFSSTQFAPQTIASIILPEGAVLIDGQIEWQGDLEANKIETIEAEIMFEKEGNLTIEAKALHEVGNGDIWGDNAFIYLSVLSQEGQFGFTSEPIDDAANNEHPPPPSVDPEN